VRRVRGGDGDGDAPEIVVEEASAGADGEPAFIAKLHATISRALDDLTSLEVSTYVTDDMSGVFIEDGRVIGAGLRAYTRVALEGDTIACVPERDGEPDRGLFEIHSTLVKQAQEARCELLRAIVDAAARLSGRGR